jgi:hypothetical protein
VSEQWPAEFPVLRVRVARPTDRLEEVVAFYRDGVGLQVIGSFEGHSGYSGVMLGTQYHLEFTHHADGSPCPAPTRDNLLVFYLAPAQKNIMERVAERLHRMGYPSVPPENPYWSADHSVTIEDPDGWRVVFMLLPDSAA